MKARLEPLGGAAGRGPWGAWTVAHGGFHRALQWLRTGRRENLRGNALRNQPEAQSSGVPNALPPPEDLIRLLNDDSPTTVAAVKAALRRLGSKASDALEDAVASEDAKLRGRARQLLSEIQRDKALTRLRVLLAHREPEAEEGASRAREGREGRDPSAHGEDIDIIDGLLAIDGVLGVEQEEQVLEQLDDWSDEVRSTLHPETSALEAATNLGNTLGGSAGLVGPEADFHHADHVSLSRTIKSRHGLPLTLSAIYAATARLAGLDAALLPFPGHVLMSLGSGAERAILDPFTGGRILSEQSCLARLERMGAPPSPRWLQPASDRMMLVRQLNNTEAAMVRHGRHRDARMLRSLLNEADRGG